MRALVLTIIRLGPSGAYIAAATSLLSVALVCSIPSSPLAWAVYTTMLPTTRTLILTLVTVSDVVFWGAIGMFLGAAVAGGYLAVRPGRYLRLRFIHAHVALIASGSAVVQISQSTAGLASISLSQFPPVSWSFMVGSPVTFALFVLILLACLSAHVAIIVRIRS